MNNGNEWWRPSSLLNAEKRHREILDDNALDLKNDFGSYRRVLKTGKIEQSGLESHNDIYPELKLLSIEKIFGPFQPNDILDAGCGMGFTTLALKKIYPSAEVYGVDVSKDAIEYACHHHLGPKFQQLVLSPETDAISFFDLIYCIEFYPFTRNTEVAFQVQMIEWFVNQLKVHGKLIIYQDWSNPNSLSSVLVTVKEGLPHLSFDLRETPNPRLLKYFPIWLSLKLTLLLNIAYGRQLSRKVLIIRRKSEV